MPTIKELRTRKGWSQQELASAAKITTNTISDFENGKRRPHKGTLQLIANALGVSPEELTIENIEAVK